MTAAVDWHMKINFTALDHYGNDMSKAMPVMMRPGLPRMIAAARLLISQKADDVVYVQGITDLVTLLSGIEDPTLVERLLIGELAES